MTVLERALVDIVSALQSLNIDYMLVGGLANAVWGEPRATVDVDVTVAVTGPALGAAVDALSIRLRPAVEQPREFVRETRVLPLDSAAGVRIGVMFALLPFELEAIQRALTVTLAGMAIQVITPEDLILMKIISDRPRDLDDATGIAKRRMSDLDRSYLEPRIRDLAESLEKPEILARWSTMIGGPKN
jgi:hypothetical protein